MDFRKLTVLTIGIAAADVALAGNLSTPSGTEITNVTNWVGTSSNPNEALYISTNEAALTNPSNCSAASTYYLDADSKISRAMILEAYAAKLNVIFTVYGGACSTDQHPLIVAVTLGN